MREIVRVGNKMGNMCGLCLFIMGVTCLMLQTLSNQYDYSNISISMIPSSSFDLYSYCLIFISELLYIVLIHYNYPILQYLNVS